MHSQKDHMKAKKGRTASLVIAGAMLIWLGMQWAAVQLDISSRYMLLLDLAVMAAMVWSLVVTFQIWRARRDADKG
jgi:membrane protein implicated in regulation of membrane protease activity